MVTARVWYSLQNEDPLPMFAQSEPRLWMTEIAREQHFPAETVCRSGLRWRWQRQSSPPATSGTGFQWLVADAYFNTPSARMSACTRLGARKRLALSNIWRLRAWTSGAW